MREKEGRDTGGIVRIGEWLVDRDTNSIRRGSETRRLQPLSINILLYLADHPERIVSADELIEEFWTGRIVGDDAVHRRIANLRKMLEDDAKNPKYIRTVSKRGYRLIEKVERPIAMPADSAPRHRPIKSMLAVTLLIFFAIAAVVLVQNQVRQHRELAAAVVSARLLLAEDQYQAAYVALEPYLQSRDPGVLAVLDKLLLPVSILTDPHGVEVSYKLSLPESQWVSLGATPLSDLSLPRGHFKLRLGDAIVMDATNPGVTLNSAGRKPRVIAMPMDQVPPDMAFIPAGKYRLGAWGFVDEFDLGAYFIDRFEVSNRDYREFVDAGGYQDPVYWQPLIDASAGQLSWSIIRETFVDLTDRPGPAGWELGAYLPGEEVLPVVGVNWYEANAYLAFRKKSLPSVHHWLRATLGPMEWKYPFAPELVPRSNVGSTQLLAVDRPSDAAVNGTYDMIGNAAEWTGLESHGARAVMGSSFRDPAWPYNFPQPRDPMERISTTGFRGMRFTTGSFVGQLPDFELFNDFSGSVRRVSDAVFEGLRHSFDYHPGRIEVADVAVVEEREFENWIRREVLIPTGRPDDPMPVYLYLPRRYSPPYQSVIYLPPADSWSPGFRSALIAPEKYQIDFVPRSGRVLIWPVYSGSHERYDNYHADAGPERVSLALERNRRVRDEIGRVIDYLESAPEFDGSNVALMALSYGATLAPFVLATESRIKASIIYSAGIAPPIPVFKNPQNDPNIFWARVHQPTLLINGRYDPIRPHKFVLGPLLDLLATPVESKASILYESGHWPLPRYLMMRDSLAWLDQYLGQPALSYTKE